MFKESITREELAAMPLRWFTGELFVVTNDNRIKYAAEILSQQKLIGFDTETRPSFKKGSPNKVALLQLTTRDQAFLFRLNRIGLPIEIAKILANPDIIKPGIAIRDDIKGLLQYRKFVPAGFIELQDVAKSLGINDFSLKKLTAIACGFRISKNQQLSNWEDESLSTPQQLYAATDAWASMKIYESFSRHLCTDDQYQMV
jgi:ribonuclease D